MGQDALTAAVMPIADKITAALLPRMKEIVASASEAAEPTIRKVITEDVLPKFGLATILGLVAGAAVAAAIGSYFATSGRARARRNPAGWPYVPMRRRVAA
jgi:hypothetical protein